MGAPLRPRGPAGPKNPTARSVRAIVLGDRPEVLSMVNALLRSEGAEIVEQTSDPRDLPDDAGKRADVVFIEAVGLHGSRWKDLLHDARQRLPDTRIVLVTRGPGRALEGPARLEGADGLVQYPIQREALTEVLMSLFPDVQFPPDKSHVSGGYARPRNGA
jgi:response regulator RpfG family c-di-GMP phosphodiesterase